MKNTLHTLLAFACATAFLAGCGDSGTPSSKEAKAAKKGFDSAAVKTTGNAVADFKAILDKLVEAVPRITVIAQSNSGAPSLSQIEDSAKWGQLMGQLHDVWKKATQAEREQLKKHADAVLEKMPEGDERNALLGVLAGILLTGGE